MLGRSGAIFALNTETIGIVEKNSERIPFFQGYYLVEFAVIAGRTENSLRKEQDAALRIFFEFAFGFLEGFFQTVHIVVLIAEMFPPVQTDAVDHGSTMVRIGTALFGVREKGE
jgi:hypothetical protein